MDENKKNLLEVKDLKVSFFTPAGEVKAVDGISYNLEYNEVMGIVGESGSGKSVEAYSIIGLLQTPGKVVGGSITFDGQDLLSYDEEQMRNVRGKDISMIFQNPMTCLNPVYTIGNQLMEALQCHDDKITKEEAWKRAVHMLELVGINNAEKRMTQYPHEHSGGMRQRAMIAMALISEPKLLIADEPTTALDVTIQAQILELMQELQRKLNMAIIIVTHDLGVIAQMADEIVVMYGGRICERGTADDIFYRPAHEYTKGLLRSIPRVDNMKEKLIPIGGNPINLLNMPKGCAFCARCDEAMKICIDEVPPELRIHDTHLASCWMNVKNQNYMEVPDKDE